MGLEKRNYAKVIDIYNRSGSAAAAEYLANSCGIKYTRHALKRLKDKPEYMYDSATDKFVVTTTATSGRLFMDLDELCMTHPATSLQPSNKAIGDASLLKDLMQQLLTERLLELNTYIKIDHINKVATINKSILVSMGYTVVTN